MFGLKISITQGAGFFPLYPLVHECRVKKFYDKASIVVALTSCDAKFPELLIYMGGEALASITYTDLVYRLQQSETES